MRKQHGGIETLLIYAIAIAAVTAIAWGLWAGFTNSYRDEGRKEIRDAWAPVITECGKRKLAAAQCVDAWLAAERDNAMAATNLRTCQAASREQNEAAAATQKAATEAIETSRRVLAEITKRSAVTHAEIDRLTKLAAAPAASEKESCNEARRILADLRAVRLRYFANSPAPGTGGEGGAGAGAGPGEVRIRP